MGIIKMLFLLSVLILVHEAGHFLAAKFFKMKVSKFGFGLPIGPTLWEKQVGDVQVLVPAFLLGGYVAFPDDDKENPLPADSPDRFLNRPIYQRLIVVSAGVIANVLCAIFFVYLVAGLWGQLPSGKYETVVHKIVAEQGESVWNSGMQVGDKIIKINGTETPLPSGVNIFATLSKKFDGKVDETYVNQNYEKLKKLNIAYNEDEIIPADVTIKLPEVGTESPVTLSRDELMGLSKIKDKQVELNETQKELRESVYDKSYYISNGKVSLNDIAYALSDNVRPVNITVERNGELIDLKTIYPNKDGLIGIERNWNEIMIPTKDFKSIIKGSNEYLFNNTYMLLYGLKQIFTGKVPINDLHGVILITKIGGEKIANEGIFSGILLAALISLDLAIVNFLPIPALDGGHVMFLIIEKIRGKKLDEETIDKIGTAGFMFLIALMIFVIFNDIYALITNKF